MIALPTNDNNQEGDSRIQAARRYSQRTLKYYPSIEKFRALRPSKGVSKPESQPATTGSSGQTHIPLPRIGIADIYGILWGILLFPYFLLVYVYLYFATLPFCFLVKFYADLQPKPTPRIKRHATFYKYFSICLLTLVPALPVICFNIAFMGVFSIVAALPVGIFTIGFSQMRENYRILAPYRSCGLWSIFDMICALIGAQYRQGLCEFHISFIVMLTFDPFLKWFMLTNPFFHRLEERFCNQWTKNLVCMTRQEVHDGLYRNVAFSLHVEEEKRDIDDNRFAAHYQIPPEDYPYFVIPNSGGVSGPCAVGYQFTGSIAHMTYACHPKQGQFPPRSTTGDLLIFSVLLNYWNPFHMLTGYVEVSERTSQALEHPMWCVQGDHWFAATVFRSVGKLFFGYAAEITADLVEDHQDSGPEEKAPDGMDAVEVSGAASV